MWDCHLMFYFTNKYTNTGETVTSWFSLQIYKNTGEIVTSWFILQINTKIQVRLSPHGLFYHNKNVLSVLLTVYTNYECIANCVH